MRSEMCVLAYRCDMSRAGQSGIKTTHAGSAGAVGSGSAVILRYPACTRKSQTRLVLLTSIFTRSRASRRRSLPPRRAYSRTSVSLMTRYGFGRIRNCEQSACSAGVSKCSEGLLAKFRGTADYRRSISIANGGEEWTYVVGVPRPFPRRWR